MELGELRKDYRAGDLRRADLAPDPFAQFEKWFQEATACKDVIEPNAMTLATARTDGSVQARIVLLKAWDERGFRFYTNYASEKAAALEENPRAALLFFWPALERQVQIRGSVEKTSREDSEAYFRTRPLASRIGAWASQQSWPVANRAELEARFAEIEQRFADGNVPLPPFWGGYLLRPDSIEFWQGRTGRLHDRFRYSRTAGGWTIERLSP